MLHGLHYQSFCDHSRNLVKRVNSVTLNLRLQNFCCDHRNFDSVSQLYDWERRIRDFQIYDHITCSGQKGMTPLPLRPLTLLIPAVIVLKFRPILGDDVIDCMSKISQPH